MTEPSSLPAAPSGGEFVLYQTQDARTRVQVRLIDGALWLTQRQMAELFQKDVRTVNEHLKNIYADGELDPHATIRKFRIVAREGARDVERLVDHFNLDAVLQQEGGVMTQISGNSIRHAVRDEFPAEGCRS